MSQRQKKASFSAQKGGLSVQELKQMTAKRMAEGGPRSQPPLPLNSTFPPPSTQSRGTFSSPDRTSASQPHDQHPHIPSQPGAIGIHSSPSHPPNQQPPVPQADKGLSVQELKALTRRRLAREFIGPSPNHTHSTHNTHATKPPSGANRSSNHNSNPNTSTSFNPAMTYPIDHTSPDRRSVEDSPFSPSRQPQQQQQQQDIQRFLSSQHGGLRSGSTSPTVDSCSTSSDNGDYPSQYQHQMPYHSKHDTSPLLHPSTRQYHHNSPYRSSIENQDSLDPISLPPRRGGGGRVSERDRERERGGERYREPFSALSISDHDQDNIQGPGHSQYSSYRGYSSSNSSSGHSSVDHPRQRQNDHHNYIDYDDDYNYDPRSHPNRSSQPRHSRDHHDHHDFHDNSLEPPERRCTNSYADGSISGIHSGLHAKLVSLEQQQLAREQRERDRERDREREREYIRRQQQQQQLKEKYMHPSYSSDQTHALKHHHDIPHYHQSHGAGSGHDSLTAHAQKNSSAAQLHHPLYESSDLRKMAMNKARTNSGYISGSNGHGSTGHGNSGYDLPPSTSSLYNFDNSLLPSGSPFYPATSSSSTSSGAFTNPPESELSFSPPTSPRSLRNSSRRPLSINCPAPVRIRSSSDSNDLAYAVAESVLLTPTAGMSPAASFRKGIASSPNSRRSSLCDSPRGSLSSANVTGIVGYGQNNVAGTGGANSDTISNGGGSSGGESSVLDVDRVMSNQFSLDSNDCNINEEYYSNSSGELAAIMKDL